jgi:hypothetical protein
MHLLERTFIQLSCLRMISISLLEEMFKLAVGESWAKSLMDYQHLQKLPLSAIPSVTKSGASGITAISSRMNCSAQMFRIRQDQCPVTVEVNLTKLHLKKIKFVFHIHIFSRLGKLFLQLLKVD